MVDDLRRSMRSLWRERGHSAAVVLILASGIGIVTSVFTVYSALFLRPLPLDEPDRLVVVRRQDPSGDLLRLDGSAWTFLNLLKWMWVGAAPVGCHRSRGTASR